jgi:serine/threonine-protein kinase
MRGKILGGRYSLDESLGGGGTAAVYKGRDSLLNRTVAVKVLNLGLTYDEDFIARFKREAQAAASMTNPHIVGIYDVGQDDSFYYIVLEYVEGKTLKEHIDENAPLSQAQVLDIAMQITEGLKHAHRHGVIHRDIKPHNILITRDGQVKVTDFGIARAPTNATLTQSESLIGSVHYMSPEQARGGFTNERSDLYSLGVVMYEMLTGEPPFSGDSMFSIALKHLQEQPRPIEEINQEVNMGLVRVVNKAMSKEQANRYQSAAELLDDLASLADLSKTLNRRRPTESAEETYTPPSEGAVGSRRRTDMSKKPPRKIPVMAILATLMVLTMLGVGAGLLYTFWPRPEVQVPEVVGLPLSEAERILRAADLNITIREGEYSSEIPAGTVMRQHPEPGRPVRSGRAVEVFPSRGADLHDVPNVVGTSIIEAQIILTNSGFVLGQQVAEFHDTIEEGVVISQNPRPPVRTERGTPVDVVVSRGPSVVYVNVPILVGMSRIDAENLLQELGLTIGQVAWEYSDRAEGIVIRQGFAGFERVPRGTAVSLVVSRGILISRVVVIPADRLTPNSRVEIFTEDREGRRVFFDRVVNPSEGDIRVEVEAVAAYRLVVVINGVIDRDEVIGGE